MAKIIKDNLTYVVFNEVYLRYTEPKLRRRAHVILEAAIQCFSRKGFDAVTLVMIARESGVTRPLLRHYFEDLNEIRVMAMKYVRLIFQRRVLESVLKEKDPVSMLDAYVRSCFAWVDELGVHARVWLSFLHRCSRLETDRVLNTEAASTGHERIAALLRQGNGMGVFQLDDFDETAKSIQTLIMGAMITYAVENHENLGAYVASTIAHVRRLAGGPSVRA